MRRLSAADPEVPVYTLVVQDDWKLSREVVEWTEIQHESPQMFLLRRGATA